MWDVFVFGCNSQKHHKTRADCIWAARRKRQKLQTMLPGVSFGAPRGTQQPSRGAFLQFSIFVKMSFRFPEPARAPQKVLNTAILPWSGRVETTPRYARNLERSQQLEFYLRTFNNDEMSEIAFDLTPKHLDFCDSEPQLRKLL